MLNTALRLIRVFHNIKQGNLAEMLGISQSHLSEIEAGHKQPTLELLQKYSEVFDLPVSSILYFAEKRDSKKSSKITNAISSKALQMLDWVNVITEDKRKTNHP